MGLKPITQPEIVDTFVWLFDILVTKKKKKNSKIWIRRGCILNMKFLVIARSIPLPVAILTDTQLEYLMRSGAP